MLLHDFPILYSVIVDWHAPISNLLIDDYSANNLATLDKCDASDAM